MMSAEKDCWREVLLQQTVYCMKLGIFNDIREKLVPFDVDSFSKLHDYVDANEYGGFTIPEFNEKLVTCFGGLDSNGHWPQGMLDFINEAQGIIDNWLKKGDM